MKYLSKYIYILFILILCSCSENTSEKRYIYIVEESFGSDMIYGYHSKYEWLVKVNNGNGFNLSERGRKVYFKEILKDSIHLDSEWIVMLHKDTTYITKNIFNLWITIDTAIVTREGSDRWGTVKIVLDTTGIADTINFNDDEIIHLLNEVHEKYKL